jgi:hypothetical protein
MKTTFFDSLVSDFGIWEHSDGEKPLKGEGYALDDAARALILTQLLRRTDQSNVLFDYIKKSFKDGTVYGQANEKGEFFDAPAHQDPIGQVCWAMAICWQRNFRADEAKDLFNKAKGILGKPEFMRGEAYALLGAVYIDPGWAAQIGGDLFGRFNDRPGDWPWPEDEVTYGVGVPPYALLRYAKIMGDEPAGHKAIEVLRFLDKGCRAYGQLEPIGNQGWWPRGGKPAQFSQQPIDVAYMIWACMAAYEFTHEQEWNDKAWEWWNWFDGKNAAGKKAYDPETGKCTDGLDGNDGKPVRLSTHSGAESNICFLLAEWAKDNKQTF